MIILDEIAPLTNMKRAAYVAGRRIGKSRLAEELIAAYEAQLPPPKPTWKQRLYSSPDVRVFIMGNRLVVSGPDGGVMYHLGYHCEPM